jgi:predicted CopG family antitoxin
MTNRGSDSITITLRKATVRMLRGKKGGSEKWDEFIRRLARRKNCGIECAMCDDWLETDEMDISLDDLAGRHGWTGIYSAGMIVDKKGIETRMKLGYMCRKCSKERRRISD